MNRRTLEALQGSIEKWKGIIAGYNTDEGVDNCPLCLEFNNGQMECNGCPVAKASLRNECVGTPYSEWCHHHSVVHPEYWDNKIHSDCPDCLKLAKKELKFLKSLLPKSVKHKH